MQERISTGGPKYSFLSKISGAANISEPTQLLNLFRGRIMLLKMNFERLAMKKEEGSQGQKKGMEKERRKEWK